MKAGDIISTWWESDLDYHVHSGIGVVVGTSRSKRRLTKGEAVEALRDGYDETIVGRIECRWHSFTQAQADSDNIPAEADVGSFGEDGWGQAWIDVSLPIFACDRPDVKA